MRHPVAPCAMVAGLVLLLAAGPSTAQPYARFAVPDSALAGALRAAGNGYEAAWNALFVGMLRARAAGADSAARLEALATRIAAAEPAALGSHIAPDALARWRVWSASEREQRVSAAVAESLGVIAVGARDFHAADSLYSTALARYEKLGEKRRAAWMLGSLGVSAFQAQDYARADSVYQLALAARRALGDQRMIGASLNSLGATRLVLGKPAEAYPYLVAAAAVREKTGERGGLASTLNSLALAQQQLGRADSAGVTFERALETATAAGDSARVLEVVSHLAGLRVDQGDAASAIALCGRGLVLARSRGDRALEALIEEQLGGANLIQGRFAAAAEHLETAVAIDRETGNVRAEIAALTSLGQVGIELQDPARARPPLERALTLADSVSDPDARGRALVNLSIASRLEGDPTRAVSLATAALDLGVARADSERVHDAAVTLGQCAVDRGDYAAAATWFERARRAGDPGTAERMTGDEINLGAVYANLGRLEEAEKHFRAAETRATTAASPELTWPAWLGLGDVAERRGRYAEALAWDRRAATLIDTLRARQGAEGTSIALLSRRLFAFEALIHLLGKLSPQFPDSGYDAEAFAWAERTRARAFLDLLGSQGRGASRLAPVDLKRAQALIPSETAALVEYSLGDSSSSLWVVTKESWKRFILPPRNLIQTRAEVLRRALADPADAEGRTARSAARALYRMLIAPAEGLLKLHDALLISPDGALARVPFEALLSEDAAEGTPLPRGAYLMERHTISYTPSAAALATPAHVGGHGDVLAIGAPRFGSVPPAGLDRPLAPLPNTADELSALRAIAPPRRFTALAGAAATRDSVLASPVLGRAEVVHIATHGMADETAPERSGLWFSAATDTTPPGFVSLADLFALRIQAGLVTLSACETGLGRLERGEGVIGLSRAFLVAGSRSVVVSLWSVNDRSTSLLMKRFYESLLGKGATRAAALTSAKRALLADPATRSPFYWAPFVLIGASGKL